MRSVLVVLAMVVMMSPAVRAEWQPPENGTLTEKQVVAYLAAFKEWAEILRASGKAMDQASGAAAIGIAGAADARFKQALAKQSLTQEEFDWIGTKVWEARGSLMIVEMMSKGREDLAKQVKTNADSQAAVAGRITRVEAALKSGRRVLGVEEKKSIVESAGQEAAEALDEARQSDVDAAAVAKEAAEFDREAADALALAANPPPSVPADERADYIAGKKEEAATAKERAAELRQTEADTRKAAAEARDRAKLAAQRAKDPEAVRPDEAADVKEQLTTQLADLRAELKSLQDAAGFLQQADAQMTQRSTEMLAKANKQNVEIVQKHVAAFDAIFAGK